MRGALELLVFAGASAVLHVAVFLAWSDRPAGTDPAAGASGEAVLTLAAAAPSLAAQVAAWQAAPTAVKVAPGRATPAPETAAPDRVSARSDAVMANSGSGIAILPQGPATEGLPDIGQPPPAPVRTPPSEPAKADLAEAPAELPSKPAPARKAETAKGRAAEKGTAAGASVSRKIAALTPEASKADIADWGARIRARIERRKKSPRGSWDPGSATVRIQITRDGGLASLGVLKSSGDARLDRAALDAVKRAGRFPAAPDGFARATMTFDLPVSFVR